MVFASDIFLFVFLPFVIIVYYVFYKYISQYAAIVFLFMSSVLFYGAWNYEFVHVLTVSAVYSYFSGFLVSQDKFGNRRAYLYLTIFGHIAILAYYKYDAFFINTYNQFVHHNPYSAIQRELPLGISFFTFHQIAYLVECYRRKTRETSAVRYGLFVTFFPQLIAGPILYAREMLPQFWQLDRLRITRENLSIGLSILSIGLFKKLVLADGNSDLVGLGFASTGGGVPLAPEYAWSSVLAYAFQIYFDFSGYSDMAIGLGRIFGINLPLNFHSPYKARSIQDFWRRWHMSLSRFLRDYVYVVLGGNRRGNQKLNLMITMLLGGLWHGAGFGFIIWGGLHGAALIARHTFAGKLPSLRLPSALAAPVGIGVTFVFVCVCWVFFRANSLGSATVMLLSMTGYYWHSGTVLAVPLASWAFLGLGALVAWGLPNTQQIMGSYGTAVPIYDHATETRRIAWKPNAAWALIQVALLSASLSRLDRVSEFLYFQF